MEIALSVKNVVKKYGDFTAVYDVSFNVEDGKFFSILGPSGCGKTTLLRMIAGFFEPTAGSIEIRGKNMANVPPNKRPVNLVFQHLALFPMMDVKENIAFGLRVKKWDNKIPQNYYIQVLHYMLVDETFRFGLVKALLRLEYAKQNNGLFESIPSEFREYFINRDDEQVQADLKYLLEKEIEFWRYVKTDKRPPLILPEI